MISRRRFLEAGSVTGIAAATHPIIAAATPDNPLPPSLARLQSRKSEATPITREERQQRQERSRKLMRKSGLDAIVFMEGTSLKYFTGIRWWGGERMFAFVLPAKQAAFYVCPAFEESRARELISNAPDGDFQPVAGNPVMHGQRACLFQHVFHDRFYGFDCHLTSHDQWVMEETEASLP